MFTFSIVVIDIGVPYFVQVIGGGALPTSQNIGGGEGVGPLCPLPMSMYVTYMRLFVVPKCKTLTCGYTLRHRSTLQCLFPLGQFHSPTALHPFVVVYKIHC